VDAAFVRSLQRLPSLAVKIDKLQLSHCEYDLLHLLNYLRAYRSAAISAHQVSPTASNHDTSGHDTSTDAAVRADTDVKLEANAAEFASRGPDANEVPDVPEDASSNAVEADPATDRTIFIADDIVFETGTYVMIRVPNSDHGSVHASSYPSAAPSSSPQPSSRKSEAKISSPSCTPSSVSSPGPSTTETAANS
jgi:hypothetical protein